MNGRKRATLSSALAVVVQLFILVQHVGAQTSTEELSSQNLRPYWHVFIAFALAWLLVGGWLFSVGKRLSRIEQDLMK